MARYIDADKLLARIKGRHTVRYFTPTKEDLQLIDIFEIINTQPTADVVEVRHGEWLDNYEKITTLGGNGVPKEYLCGYKCSLCGRTEIGKEPYCNCGAKMDGGKNEPTK